MKFAMHQNLNSNQEFDTSNLLKIIALGDAQIEEGKVIPAIDVIRKLRGKKMRRLPNGSLST